MSKSNLYRVHPERKILQSVKEVDFSDFGIKERFDIQEWVESTPEVLGEELLIIAKEKSYFEGSRERPDLIALDKMGNVVVIELKRDDSGENTEWQAIKYASYWSKFKLSDKSPSLRGETEAMTVICHCERAPLASVAISPV